MDFAIGISMKRPGQDQGYRCYKKFLMYERIIWFARGKVVFCITFNEQKQKIIYNFAKDVINFFDAGLVLAYY